MLLYKIIILENGDSEWMRDMANALLKLNNINVITVNWGDLSSGVYQWVVFENMPKAGILVIFYSYRSSYMRFLENMYFPATGTDRLD